MKIPSVRLLKKYTDIRSLEALWTLLWVPCIVIFIAYAVSLLTYPYDWEPGEGSKILYAQRLLQGKAIYKSNQTFPMLGNCYPPLYFIVTALVMLLTGPQLMAGRLVSIVAMLAMTYGVYRVARMLVGSRAYAIVAAAVFLFPAPLASWYPLARIDGLCASLLFLATYISFMDRKEGVRYACYAGLAAVAALFTKQTALFGVVMLGAYYCVNKRWKKSAAYCLTICSVGLLSFLLLQLWSDGWFFHNLFTENVHRVFFWKRYALFFGWLFYLNPALWIFAGAAIVLQVVSRKFSIWHFYFVGGLINALLIGANGSGYNYFFTFWSGFSLLFVQGVAYLQAFMFARCQTRTNFVRLSVFGVMLLATLLNFATGKPRFMYQQSLIDYIPTQADRRTMHQLEEFIAESPEPVFVDRMPAITLRYDKSDYYMEPAFIQELHHSDRWSAEPMAQMIAQKKFSRIFMLTNSLVPYPVKSEISKYYKMVRRIKIATFEIWRTRYMLIFEPA